MFYVHTLKVEVKFLSFTDTNHQPHHDKNDGSQVASYFWKLKVTPDVLSISCPDSISHSTAISYSSVVIYRHQQMLYNNHLILLTILP